MTKIDDITDATAHLYGIELDAARDVVTTYVDQVKDDSDMWNAEAEDLTIDGAAVVRHAISEGYARRVYSTTEAAMLAELDDISAKLPEMTERRDELVRKLMRSTVARADVADAARLTEGRLYQIRNGH